MGSDTACHAVRLRPGLFQSTLPGWGATLSKLGMRPTLAFQSTLPGWGATKPIQGDRQNRKDFNPRSPDGERPGASAPGCGRSYFNPRSPDGERRHSLGCQSHFFTISIHAPRMGSDCAISPLICPSRRFQSTLPGWGATSSWSPASTRVRHFNPRSPDGERRCGSLCGISPVGYFNPRSPDGERRRSCPG